MSSSFNSLITFILTIKSCLCGYNLIDEYPSCISRGYCPYAKPWNFNSVHPNSEERTIYIQRNIARLQPTAYKNAEIGKRKFGWYGEQTKYYCAAKAQTNPMYWLSEANQVCRFHTWSALTCTTELAGSHSTCPAHCNLFPSTSAATSQCGYITRSLAFLKGTGAKLGGEGIWGGNMGYFTDHCKLVFEPENDHVGIGWYPGANIVTNLGIVGLSPPNWPIPHGSHFHWKTKVGKADFGKSNGKDLFFLVQYYGKPNNNRKAQSVYLVYDNTLRKMSLKFGSSRSGFYQMNVVVPSKCKPYAFVIVDDAGTKWRLPEDEQYFFGTTMLIEGIGMVDPYKHYGPREFECEENHYYYNGNSWRANGGPKANGNDRNCIGCGEAKQLAAVYKTFLRENTIKPPDDKPATTKSTIKTTKKTNTGSSSSDACVKISELTVGGKDFKGEWEDAGSVWNRQTVYKKGNWFLYNVYDEDYDEHCWAISGTKGSANWNNGWCTASDILKCDGQWDIGSKVIANSKFESCGGSNLQCSNEDCVKISRLMRDKDNKNYNGQWKPKGCFNGEAYYQKSGISNRYLCYNTVKKRWIITKKLCDYGQRAAYCRSSKVLNCDDNWAVDTSTGFKNDKQVTTVSCSAAFTLDDDEECEREYNDKLCMYGNTHNDTLWNEDKVEFELYTEKCSNEKPVYHYTVYDKDDINDDDTSIESIYYIHYYNNGSTGQWILSKDIVDVYSSAICYKENLLKCTKGSWDIKKTTVVYQETDVGNFTVYQADAYFDHFVDDKMRIYNGGCDDTEGNNKSTAIAIIVIIVLFVLIAIVGCIIWKMRHNDMMKMIQETVKDESEEEMEIEKTVLYNTQI